MGRHGYGHEHGCVRLLFLLAVLSVTSAVGSLVSGESDFLNIDCGKERGFSYNDSSTGLLYTSDHQYVSTGEIHKVANVYRVRTNYYDQFRDLRSFPNGTRNCYKLPVKPHRKYLLRSWFMYGNYDNNDMPQFALHGGVNHWYTVIVSNAFKNLFLDFVFVGGVRGSMNLCLVNTGDGTPFISGLELRPLQDEMYPQANAFHALALATRTNFGTTLMLRYPNDTYDRIWMSYSPSELTPLTTASIVDTIPTYPTPSDVLRTADYPTRGSTLNVSYNLVLDPAMENEQVHIFLHFAELQKLRANESRAFDITLNDKLLSSETVKPTYLKALFGWV